MITAHTDVVGSLLRPAELLRAREERAAGRLDAPAFKAVEDAAVDGAVRLQEEAGMAVATDGEMRRLSFQSQMTEAVEGFGEWDLDAFLWGNWQGDAETGDWSRERPTRLGVEGRLRRRRFLSVEELVYLRARVGPGTVPKVTLPSPSLFASFWDPERSAGAYPTLEAFLADVTDLLREEVAELARLGARYLQLDAPHYPLLLEPGTRAFYEARGGSWRDWLARGIELDNAVMDAAPGVTFGFHLCRGNQGSRWLVEGGYDPIAGPVFRGTRAQRLLLEYDDERSGSFAPLAEVPEDKTVVLGLVTTKTPRVESPEWLEGQVREAARYVPLERLALSPQCGFSTSVVGNRVTVEDERRKLAAIRDAAERLWR
ncbi:methionine synthase [Thiohalorhabdus denitrificans]|uniref:5-methyltetrahydropteroyltriglutamate--homocysteine methyltransferase n=1 Tax=Thiohalorhabdus denitrificans TaxID=381306 RepID=A0A0P9EM09_9GAMM|nr:cobalamin-independent methionine synthase II family protein [Thiohalorhabdus denitrificans]KPV39624.1 methionine synthase [Thiohalorhabdus denitrificans]SCX96372.1 5-methyltetrahydropteroyltriglutamate--homocysteine methyltransferase [Thiohalorhabdus denitrificans]